ncbi:MAG: methionine--tRNA ligase, partial [Candidatus Limnocylindria bacterium]
VQRTFSLTHRHFGAVPEPGELTSDDAAVLAAVEGGFVTVGDHLDAARFRAGLAEAMRLSASVNRYLGEQEPWKTINADEARAATVLWVALQCVDNLKTLIAPFLPFSSQRLHEVLGGEGTIAPMPELVGGAAPNDSGHRALTGRYQLGGWEPSRLPPGRPLAVPAPLFRKLDPATTDDEVERMAQRAASRA